MSFPVRAKPSPSPMRRGRLPAYCCRHLLVDGPERPSGRNAYPSGVTPSTIMSPTHKTGSRTEISPGARAHTTHSAGTAPVEHYTLGPPGRPAGDRAPPLALSQQPGVDGHTDAAPINDNPGSRT